MTPRKPTDPTAETVGASNPTDLQSVKERYRRIVAALNSTPASFIVRSKEGLAMYRGLESHSANGRTSDLVREGRIASARQARRAHQPAEEAPTVSPNEPQLD